MARFQCLKKTAMVLTTAALGAVMAYGGVIVNHPAHADAIDPQTTKPAYDISQYQGHISNSQAQRLKNEVSFVTLKAENGGLYTDPQFSHNAAEMKRNHIPYGVYDYSLYANDDQAKSEAQSLYQRAPHAKYYVNDSEENDAGSDYNSATQAWANEIHSLTNKPAVLYSDMSFMNGMDSNTRNAYDALWVADYGIQPQTNYHYDLWQFADNHYSNALGEKLDASTFPANNNKPLSFWVGKNSTGQASVQPVDHQTQEVVDQKTNHRKSRVKVTPKRYRRVKPVVKRPKTKRITYNPKYYRSRRIHYLKVTGKNGINLYTLSGKRIGHVKSGMVLWVRHFKTFYYKRTGYMTKAIGYHWGRSDMFTANKSIMKKD